ncbi:MAG: hypothetical protein JG776_2170 [Caloramator sp.]|jgi:hypothetical protein|uniref:hypothetical protein n=1 Tax=Caloramator sp. TaxID=1871330 RepID=UPI001DACE27C|nr:hypothetical protein [Caloramator sp.]MBZ4664452.1 hypothetical protein [Caloramator sp.]
MENNSLSDVELEQMLISIIHTENNILMKRIWGCLKKELAKSKNELLNELKKGDKYDK